MCVEEEAVDFVCAWKGFPVQTLTSEMSVLVTGNKCMGGPVTRGF